MAFLSRDPNQKAVFVLKKAECRKREQLFKEAFGACKRIGLAGLNDSLLMRVLYEQAISAYLAGNFKQAQSALIQLDYQSKTKQPVRDHRLLQVLVLNELHEWQKADSLLSSFIQQEHPGKDSLLSYGQNLYSANGLPRMKSQKKAYWFSFVPGLGLMYAGAPGEGIFNFLLSGGSLAFGSWQVYQKYYLTGYVSGTFLLQKFYFGGRHRTEHLIDQWNYEKSKEFNEKVRGFILAL